MVRRVLLDERISSGLHTQLLPPIFERGNGATTVLIVSGSAHGNPRKLVLAGWCVANNGLI